MNKYINKQLNNVDLSVHLKTTNYKFRETVKKYENYAKWDLAVIVDIKSIMIYSWNKKSPNDWLAKFNPPLPHERICNHTYIYCDYSFIITYQLFFTANTRCFFESILAISPAIKVITDFVKQENSNFIGQFI